MVNSLSDSVNKYRTLCNQESSIPLFSQAWWLDATAGEGAWDVALVEKGEVILAAMPYVLRKRFGFTLLGQPALTQTLGPWLQKSGAKYSNRLGLEKDLLSELIRQLPDFASFHQNWHFSQTNWLPFFWQGFQQTTRYTYRLPDLSDLDAVWSGFRENIRSDIRKASNRFHIRVRTDLGVDDFLKINRLTFERQGVQFPYSPNFIRSLDLACEGNRARKVFIAEDELGQRHAGVYIVWDEQSAYYLMGGGDPKLRASGATSLCMWEAIQFAATKVKSFDFEGSMLEPVERFFRAFGAIQTPYFSISKTPSKLVRLRNNLVDIFR